jgi:hypothetical protein
MSRRDPNERSHLSDLPEHIEQVRSLLGSQRFAVLATRQEDGHPYASLIAFWAADDFTHLTFCTLRTTRKFENLIAEGRVALLIDNRSNDATDLHQAAAVTVRGSCREVTGPPRDEISELFLARHPTMKDFVDSPSCAVMRVDISSYYLVTRFQNVIELHVREGQLHESNPSAR